MYHLSKGTRNENNPENHVGISSGINITSLELLDLSYCKGIDLKALAANAPVFQSLSSLIIQKCGLTYDDTQHLIKLFDKIPNLVYLDVKNNKLDLIKLIDGVDKLPSLSYLLVDGNPKPQCFMEEIRRLGLHI
jgi:Leucine-rich repeat (LRR) protein